jgi:hypothetical protein
LCGLVSHYNQRVPAIAAKLSTYQITQERKVSLFPNQGPPSCFSKDWVFVERTEDVDQSWQSVSSADLAGPDPTGISCSQSVSVPGRNFSSRIRSGSVSGSSAVGWIGLLFRKYRHKLGRELKSGRFPDEAGIWQRIGRAVQFPSPLKVHRIGLKLTKKSYT